MKQKLHKMKGIFRIQIGFSSIRIWFLNKVRPKTSVHLFDMMKKKNKN